MSDPINETISDIFCGVLEKLAFMFGEPTPKAEITSSADPGLIVEMTFRGAREGDVALLAPASICPELAANILGMDEDDPAVLECAHDALKEIVNVVCGQLLTSILGEEPVFDLSVPRISRYDSDQWRQWLGRSDTLGFMIEETPALLRFSIKDNEVTS